MLQSRNALLFYFSSIFPSRVPIFSLFVSRSRVFYKFSFFSRFNYCHFPYLPKLCCVPNYFCLALHNFFARWPLMEGDEGRRKGRRATSKWVTRMMADVGTLSVNSVMSDMRSYVFFNRITDHFV